jgi:crotonobetainyl-CoA:carnitine CoA-transferase CaiB-like acyl-CoA transferase
MSSDSVSWRAGAAADHDPGRTAGGHAVPDSAGVRSGFLAGLRVLELGDHVSGATATWVLRTLGASVDKVPEERSALRRQEPATPGPDSRSVLSVLLDDGKTILGADRRFADIGALDDYDLVVCDRVGGPPDSLGRPAAAAYLDLVARRRSGAWVTITPFGVAGRRGDWPGSELTVSAACGLLDAVRDPKTGRPVKMAGNQSLLAAGHAAALAACHALDLARRRDTSVHLDLSAQEAGIATGPVLACSFELLNSSGDSGSRRYGAPAGIYDASDGAVRISAMEDHQWEGLLRALDQPDWATTYPTTADRIARAEEIDAALVPLIGRLTKMQCERRLQAEGVPSTAMYTMSELLNLEQFAWRAAVRTTKADDVEVRSIGAPFITEETPDRTPSDRRPHGLERLRVLEVGHVLAAPLATSLLGAMGASVIKLEDPQRLDMYRRRAPFIDSHPGTNWAAYFAVMNHSKRSLTVDMEQEPAVFEELCRTGDVVIENLGPSRARRLGVDAPTLHAAYPHLLALSSSGYGHTGPLSAYRIYAYNLHTSCGLLYLTRTLDGGPVAMEMAWADLISGYALAVVVAAWAVGPQGNDGSAVDFSMAELVAARFNEYLAAHDAGLGGDPDDGTNHQAPGAPDGVYLTAGGRWLALSVEDDRGFQALRAVLGDPPELADIAFARADGRRRQAAALEAALARLLSAADARATAEALGQAGVAASAVLSAADVVGDADLADRGFFGEVEHPEWGRRRILGLPWQAVGEGALPLRAAPTLGELNEQLSAEGRHDAFGLVDATEAPR